MTAALLATAIALSAGVGGQNAPKGYNHANAIWLAARVQAYYNKTKDFKAKFKQIYQKAYHGKQKARWGYMWVKKPGLMRWNYSVPRVKQLICDGKTLWIYDPGHKQVFYRSIKTSAVPSAVSFLWGKGKILNEFYVMIVKGSKYAKPGLTVLRLKPKIPNSNYKHILFVVNAKSAVVMESIVYDHLRNKNHYYFMNPKANTGVPDSQFTFKPPRGIRVIKASGKQLKP